MINRRALLGTAIGATTVTVALTIADMTHRLDDVARAVGIEPKPQSDPADDLLLAAVAEDQNVLLATIEATAARHPGLATTLKPFTAIGREHVEAVGGTGKVPRTEPVAGSASAAVAMLVEAYSAASKARADDAVKAVSPDLARVLASMSAGLAQCARTVGELA